MVDETLPQERRDFYVYVIFRPNGVPCYVGKGKKDRWKRTLRYGKNIHLRRILESTHDRQLPTVIVRSYLTEPEAFQTEIAFIAALGREIHGGVLVNLTDGGEGPSGQIFDPEVIERIVSKNRGRKRSPEVGRAISAAKKGVPRPFLKGVPLKIDHRQKIGAAQKGKPKPLASDETKAKMSAVRKGVKRGPLSDTHRLAISAAKLAKNRKGIKNSQSHNDAIRRATKGLKKSAAHVASMRLAQRLRRKRNSLCRQLTLAL